LAKNEKIKVFFSELVRVIVVLNKTVYSEFWNLISLTKIKYEILWSAIDILDVCHMIKMMIKLALFPENVHFLSFSLAK
jgi:hypothetical protein